MNQFDELLKKAIKHLAHVLTLNPVCGSHDLNHMVTVLMHAKNALLEYNKLDTITNTEKLEVLLASLLHDADDAKFFPNNKNFENATNILIKLNIPDNSIDNIIHMISLVSASKNGDNIPENLKDKEYYFYPRYADRLEALGVIGVKRCYKYTQTIKNPLYTNTTLRPKNKEDLWNNIATEERYNNYTGKSVSMIDHYYDKLLRLGKFPIKNNYFDKICDTRNKVLVDIVLEFGKQVI